MATQVTSVCWFMKTTGYHGSKPPKPMDAVWVGVSVGRTFEVSDGDSTTKDEQRRIMAYLDSLPLSWDLRQARLASLPSVLNKAFNGEL